MLKTTTALTVLIVSTAGMAFAAGPEPTPVAPVVVAPPPPPFWAGGYVGAQLGYAFSDFDLGSVTSPDDFNEDSVIGGITAGYLWDLGNGWYLGPEFQYDWADLSVADSTTGDSADFDEIARLKLIAGYELGNGLLFGSVGVAYASLDSVGGVFDAIDGSDTSYVVGLGYDYRVGDNWTVGGEYQYHNFTGIGDAGGDVDVNTIHLRAMYRF